MGADPSKDMNETCLGSLDAWDSDLCMFEGERVRREGQCMHLADALTDGILHAGTSEELVDPLDNTLDD